MKCSHCGAPLPTSSTVCFHCGKQPDARAEAGGRAVARKASSPRGTIAMVFLLLVVAGLGAGGWLLMAGEEGPPAGAHTGAAAPLLGPPTSDEPAKPAWTGAAPLRCGRGEQHTLKAAKVEASSDIIDATADCRVTLEECDVKGGIRLSDEASVVIRGGRVDAPDDGINVTGKARLELVGVEVSAKGDALRLWNGAHARVTKGRLTAVGHSLRVDNEGQAELDAVELVGTIRTDDTAVVRLERGSVTGMRQRLEPDFWPAAAIRAHGESAVTLLGVEIKGALEELGGTIVTLEPGADAERTVREARALAQRKKRYTREGCEGLLACYVEHQSYGNVDVEIVMPIQADGRAVGAQVRKAQGANPKARACLQKIASTRVLVPFEGPPGKLTCGFTGSISAHTQMLSFSMDYAADSAAK